MGLYRTILLKGGAAAGATRVVTRAAVPGYAGPTKPGRTVARPVAPGYGNAAGCEVECGRIVIPGYGYAPVMFEFSRRHEAGNR